MLSRDEMFNQALSLPEALSNSDQANAGRLEVKLLEERARYSLRFKKGDMAAIRKATGLKLIAKIGRSTLAKTHIETCLGPDEWLVIMPVSDKAKFDKLWDKVANKHVCSIVDISYRNIGFEISGPGAVRLLSAGCPLDLSLGNFAVGRAARTVFESSSIVLIRTADERFYLEVWRSFAPYLRDFFNRVVTTRGV